MARHLYIGNDVAVSYTNGLLADGAIDVQKLSSSGPTSLFPSDTIADSDQIRIVQGGPVGIDVNIVSPWIYGRDVIAWGGQSYAAQAAQVSTVTLATNATAAKDHFIKLVNLTDGAEPFEFKNYEISATAGQTPAAQATALFNLINADKPHWINTVAETGDSYDMYHIVATKDGSSHSQIHGVDNLIEIYIAFDNGTAALTQALEGQLNPYMNSAGFGNVNL
jgi:hypothetical protein